MGIGATGVPITMKRALDNPTGSGDRRALQENGASRSCGRSHATSAGTLWMHLAVIVLLLTAGATLAYDGPTAGLEVGIPNGGSVVLDARAVMPLLDFPVQEQSVQFSARADLSYAIPAGGLPSLSASGIVSTVVGPEFFGLEPYLGAGVGLGFVAQGTVLTLHGLAGVRLPVAGGLFLVTEGQVTGGSGGLLGLGVGLGFEFSFGGER